MRFRPTNKARVAAARTNADNFITRLILHFTRDTNNIKLKIKLKPANYCGSKTFRSQH